MSRSLLLLLALCLVFLPTAAAAESLLTTHPAAPPNATAPPALVTAQPTGSSTDLLALVEPAAVSAASRETIAAGLRDKKAYRGAGRHGQSLRRRGGLRLCPTGRRIADLARRPLRKGRQPRRGAWTRRRVELHRAAWPRLAALRRVDPDRAARDGRRRLGHDRG